MYPHVNSAAANSEHIETSKKYRDSTNTEEQSTARAASIAFLVYSLAKHAPVAFGG
jgi:hypothetical protein